MFDVEVGTGKTRATNPVPDHPDVVDSRDLDLLAAHIDRRRARHDDVIVVVIVVVDVNEAGVGVRMFVDARRDRRRSSSGGSQAAVDLTRMSRFDVSLEVAPPHEHLAAVLAPIWGVALGVEPDVLIQVARVAEGPEAYFALERLVARVRPQVDLQAVLPRVQFAAVDTQMALVGLAHVERLRQ